MKKSTTHLTEHLRCLGCVLLAAAALKAGMIFDSPAVLPWYLAIILVFAELLLAGLLFSGAIPLATWWAAVLTFSCFALVAGGKAWQGEADCGCFGAVATPPWVALTVDLSALGALLFKLPRSPHAQQFSEIGWSGQIDQGSWICTNRGRWIQGSRYRCQRATGSGSGQSERVGRPATPFAGRY